MSTIKHSDSWIQERREELSKERINFSGPKATMDFTPVVKVVSEINESILASNSKKKRHMFGLVTELFRQ